MMRTEGRLFLLKIIAGLMLLSLSSAARSQSDATVNWAGQKTPAIHEFMRPSPAEYQKAIDEDKEVLRAKVVLDGSTTVEFYEKPKDIDFYDSTVVVNRRGVASRSYNIGELIKHQALSLGHVAIVSSSDSTGMLVCEYEAGAVGAREGFAILRFSPAGFELRTLPLTDFGKVVVFRSKPDQVEIWSALSDYVASDADPRNYATRTCRLQTQEGNMCGPPKRKHRRFIPSDINDPGIEIRP
jgi:hypothetical protein